MESETRVSRARSGRVFFFFSSRRRHTRCSRDWSSDVCSSDLQLFNAQVAGSSLLVIAGDWASELQDYRGLAPFPGLTQAESMRPITKEARCAYTVHANAAAIPIATIRALREATTPPTGPVYLSISAELLNRDGLEAQIGEDAHYVIERQGPARPQTVVAIARRLAEDRCPVQRFG